jgi:flagellar biosynthesis/type III secretory pathway protein FliH
MSRVIRTGAFESVAIAGEASKTRIVRREIHEAKAEADAIVKEANCQCDLLYAQAKERAAELERTVAAETRGREEARVLAALLQLEGERASLAAKAEARAVELAVLLAERLVGHALQLDPQVIASLAAQTLAQARGAANVTLVAHPDDASTLRTLLATYPSVRLEVDATLSRGDLRLVTHLGVIDASIRPQLAQLARALQHD